MVVKWRKVYNMRKYILFFLFISFMTSCKHSTLLSVAEIIEQNPQLDQVLKKYTSDSLKCMAAEFLIENLPYHYSYEGDQMKHYMKLYEIYGTRIYTLEQAQDSVARLYGQIDFRRLETKSDLKISPEYLIDNIEWAFKVWQEQPWGKNVSFADFCEYILPYRIKDEPLQLWRKKIYNEFNPMLDSIRELPEAKNPLFVAKVLLDSISKRKFRFSSSLGYGPHLGPDLVKWNAGNCRETADMLTYIFRAVGIPCGCDYMPLRGDKNVAHFWNFTLDKYGESYYMYEEEIPKPVRDFFGEKSKVYRQTFSLNKKMVNAIKGKMEKIHPSFQYPTFCDVTRLYSGKRARTLTIPCEKLFKKVSEDEMVYLCGASWMKWLPLACTYPAEGAICFDNVDGGEIFLLATYKSTQLVPLSDPFEFHEKTGGIYFFHALEKKEKIVLLNKYNQHFESFPQRMLGGVFEGSNDPAFIQRDTLFLIKTRPLRLYNKVSFSNTKPHRYVRYLGPKDSYCNISEVSFYESKTDTCKLKGEIIGTANKENGDGKHDYGNVFDGDPNTSFDYYLPTGGWAGLDFGRSYTIEKIIYTPRNRANYIQAGDEFELFYSLQGKWISNGIQIPTSDSLVYSVPQNALLYLKNHTRGNNERIFEYDKGKQRYW